MTIDENKKVHLNQLEIILGTNCNLHCKHCFGGNPNKMTLDLKYVDDVIDNITGIDELKFIGYEISLYIDLLKSVLDRFIERRVKINKLFFFTNAKVYRKELADIFNWFSQEHTTHPNKAHFQVSIDAYHFNNGFTREKLMGNISKYRKSIKNVDVTEWDLKEGIHIAGRAKKLKIEDIKYCNNVIIPAKNRKRNTFAFRPKCEGTLNTCNNGKCVCNCIVNPVVLLPNGYIYITEQTAFTALADKNFDFAFGRIDEMSLYEMVEKQREIEANEPLLKEIVFQDLKSLWWRSQRDMVYPYMLYRNIMIRAIQIKDRRTFDAYYDAARKLISKANKELEKMLGSELDILVYKNTYESINEDLEELQFIGDKHCRFFTPFESYFEIENKINKLPFGKENLFATIGFNYDEYMDLWKAYFEANYDEYARITKQHIDNVMSMLNIPEL